MKSTTIHITVTKSILYDWHIDKSLSAHRISFFSSYMFHVTHSIFSLIDMTAWNPLCVDLLQIIRNVFWYICFLTSKACYVSEHLYKWVTWWRTIELHSTHAHSKIQEIQTHKSSKSCQIIDSLTYTKSEFRLINHFICMLQHSVFSNMIFSLPLYQSL